MEEVSQIKHAPVNPTFRSNGKTRQDVFSTAAGDVIIQWPVGMTTSESQDVSCFFDLVKRQMNRTIIVEPEL